MAAEKAGGVPVARFAEAVECATDGSVPGLAGSAGAAESVGPAEFAGAAVLVSEYFGLVGQQDLEDLVAALVKASLEVGTHDQKNIICETHKSIPVAIVMPCWA